MRPLWGDIAGSLEQIMPAPSGSELWYDDRDIAALQEDKKDAAEVLNLKSSAINTLVTAGYTRQSVVAAVEAGDLEQLVEDPNSVSVQLQAGSKTPTPQNGKPAAMPALPPAK